MQDLGGLVKQLASPTLTQRLAARMVLLALQEDAVNPLIDQYYAGVDDTTGVTILEIVAEIGGPDAMAFLRGVYHFEDQRKPLRRAAMRGLLHNRHNLDYDELEELLRLNDTV